MAWQWRGKEEEEGLEASLGKSVDKTGQPGCGGEPRSQGPGGGHISQGMTIEAHFPEIAIRDACRVASEDG